MKLSSIGKNRLAILAVLIVTIVAGFYVYPAVFNRGVDFLNGKLGLKVGHFPDVPFRQGLDLQGGTQLIYRADMSKIPEENRADALSGARDVIERRVNAYGVSEPVIQTSRSGEDYRLVVELAGVKDVNQAIKMIGETPLLEFKTQGAAKQMTAEQTKEMNDYNTKAKAKAEGLLKQVLADPSKFAELARANSEDPGSKDNGGLYKDVTKGQFVPEFEDVIFNKLKVGETYPELVQTSYGYHIIRKEGETGEGDARKIDARHILITTKSEKDYTAVGEQWVYTGLTGKQLKKASVQFDPNTQAPTVSLEFNDEGKKLFADITKNNVGKPVGIFLDGSPISLPTVNEPILDGKAIISGSFSLDEAKTLAQRLNAGALPVPIEMLSQETVGATLGADYLNKSLFAGLIGLLAVVIFMILFYRLPGLFSAIALLIYGILVLAIFKLIPVTLTLSGIAGFILSIGMAVDANVLIFERMKEESRAGRTLVAAIEEGFKRAWPSIRDGNVSTLITCVILIWFTTSLVRGFAVTLSIGIIVSLFSAIAVTRSLLKAVVNGRVENWYFLMNRKKIKTE